MFGRRRYVNINTTIIKSNECPYRHFNDKNTAIKVCVEIDGYRQCNVVCDEFARLAFIDYVKAMNSVR